MPPRILAHSLGSASRRLSAAAFALGLLAALATPARAAVFDQPPRVYTFKLDDPTATPLTLLEGFHGPALEHPASTRRYLSGAFGRWRAQPWWTLAWSSALQPGPRVDALADTNAADHPETPAVDAAILRGGERLFGFEARGLDRDGAGLNLTPETPAWLARLDPASGWAAPVVATTAARFASNGLDALWSLPPRKPVFDWRCRRRPVRFVRYGAESDAFPLVLCDGAVAPQALDRLTLMARVPDAPRPGELLPDEPDPEAIARHEWISGVRLVHPRLVWLLQRISDAFPWRTIYIFSGYRPGAVVTNSRAGTHHSMHSEARAMDINVMGIPNAELFRFCRTLDDVGCGFYPNSKFVHVDVRRPGTGHAFWIDASGPGEPSRYVDAWPGVVEGGALVWEPSRDRGSGDSGCVLR